MKVKIREEKGITLVALVVTIVVLLILAGITINMVIGDNGIISKADEARDETIKSQEKSALDLAVSYLHMSNMVDGTDNLNASNLKTETEKNYGKKDSVDVKGEKIFIVTYKETGNKYLVLTDGTVIEIDNVEFDLVYYVKAQESRADIVLIPISRNRRKWIC